MCQNFITITDCCPRANVDVFIPALSPRSVNKQRLHSSCQSTVCFDLNNFYKKTTNSSHHGQTSTDRFGCLPHLRKSLSNYCVCVLFPREFLFASLPGTLLDTAFVFVFCFLSFYGQLFHCVIQFWRDLLLLLLLLLFVCLFVCLFLGVCCGLH